ncbi:Hsp20/alpha crystallin family protein [Candidatus Kapaibacterium sp.]
MTLVKYDPFRGFNNMARRMNTLISEFEPKLSIETGDFLPRVDISENEKQITIHAEMPGLSRDDFKLTVTDDKVLVLKGSKKREKEDKSDEKGVTYHRIERSCGEFTRSFVLPDYVKEDSINAKFENGVLTVTLDKSEPVMPKEIEISVN